MGGKTAVAAGLLAGVFVGGLLMGGLLAFMPGTTTAPTPPPAPTVAPALAPTAFASPGPGVSASPVAPPPASPSAAASPSASSGLSPTTAADTFGVGEPAPPLVVPKVGGATIDLASLKGKPVWVNFMATSCPACIDELPMMAGFAARYADTGLVVLPVDVREDEASVAAFFTGLGVDLPVGLDLDGAAQFAWGALALPVHFWIDADGTVRDAALGGIGPDLMATGLGSILPGVTVTP